MIGAPRAARTLVSGAALAQNAYRVVNNMSATVVEAASGQSELRVKLSPTPPRAQVSAGYSSTESLGNSANKLGNLPRSSNGLSNANGRDIAKALDGVTTQSTKIAQAINSGEMRVSVLGDELFERMLGAGPETVASAIEDRIFLRRSSASILTDTVHEGTHALDYINDFGRKAPKRRWSWEKRAFYYERQYQITTGQKPEISTPNDLLDHISNNYENDIYYPYED
jgi:hypothetical protein